MFYVLNERFYVLNSFANKFSQGKKNHSPPIYFKFNTQIEINDFRVSPYEKLIFYELKQKTKRYEM